jgi:hypothetical protein
MGKKWLVLESGLMQLDDPYNWILRNSKEKNPHSIIRWLPLPQPLSSIGGLPKDLFEKSNAVKLFSDEDLWLETFGIKVR